MQIILHDLFIGNYEISQRFGVNPNNYKWIKDYKGNPIKGHNGLDIATPNGVLLLNPFPQTSDVVVTRVGFDKSGYGWFVRLWDRTQKCVVIYAHCQEIIVREWTEVAFQRLVGYTNNTGWSTGPHVHFGLYKVDDRGNKLNRDNGFDGWLDPLDKNIVKWEVLNPTKPGRPVGDDALAVCLTDRKKFWEERDQARKDLEQCRSESAKLKHKVSELEGRLSSAEADVKIKVAEALEAYRKELREKVMARLFGEEVK